MRLKPGSLHPRAAVFVPDNSAGPGQPSDPDQRRATTTNPTLARAGADLSCKTIEVLRIFNNHALLGGGAKFLNKKNYYVSN